MDSIYSSGESSEINLLHNLSKLRNIVYSKKMTHYTSCNLTSILQSEFIIIIRQPLCPVVGRRPQHAVSKLACLMLSSARSCRSSICPGRLSTAFLVIWSPSSDTRGPSVVFEVVDLPCPGTFHFSHIAAYLSELAPINRKAALS